MPVKRPLKNKETMAHVAERRADAYGVLVGVFESLPDEDLLIRIKGNGLFELLDSLYEWDRSRFKSGVDHVKAYCAAIGSKPDEGIINELSVDRTRILRGTGNTELQPPYEGAYKGRKNTVTSALQVKKFYRKAGIIPDETVPEPPDYLCVELDFMRQLCLREQEQWLSHDNVKDTILLEEAFLREHLGSWLGEFCSQAQKDALTDFYRGFVVILDSFVAIDKGYLRDLIKAL